MRAGRGWDGRGAKEKGRRSVEVKQTSIIASETRDCVLRRLGECSFRATEAHDLREDLIREKTS